MEILIIVQDSPYGSERPYQALRMADALLKLEDALELTVYLTADGVQCAKKGQVTPKGYYNIERMLKPVLKKGLVIACRMCLEARGLGEDDLMDGVRQVPLAEGATLVLEADKVLTY
ncbi:MAG: DsrE family protein [Deltaproteobacteria bacterium]|nr:DsrE family protein [Deltaproteobacteria bacterium]